MEPFRIQPNGPVQAYKTFGWSAPIQTHFRAATCAEVECDAYTNGWRSVIDETSPLGQMQASYIRESSDRHFVETRDELGMTVFVFEPGQLGFAGGEHDAHVISLEREPLYVVRDGDWRGNPTGHKRALRADDWLDDFATHQDKLADRLAQG